MSSIGSVLKSLSIQQMRLTAEEWVAKNEAKKARQIFDYENQLQDIKDSKHRLKIKIGSFG